MKLLVLDFDGVLSDSARESFEVALRTYRALGWVRRQQGDLLGAEAVLQKALEISEKLEDKEGAAAARRALRANSTAMSFSGD